MIVFEFVFQEELEKPGSDGISGRLAFSITTMTFNELLRIDGWVNNWGFRTAKQFQFQPQPGNIDVSKL